MGIAFDVLDDIQTIVITVTGDISFGDVQKMRRDTMQFLNDTGYRNFLVDMRRMQSIARGDDFTTWELGARFEETGFPLSTRTAVILPTDPKAREQAQFLHTVETNRGRGALRYVPDLLAARDWFAD